MNMFLTILASITFSLFNLVDLINHCNSVSAAKCGMHLIYSTEEQDEEEPGLTYITTMYGNDDISFRLQLDSSTQAFLYFNTEDKAMDWMKSVADSDPFVFEGKTFYVHRKDGDLCLYLETPWGDDGGFETRYVIYPPQFEEDKYRLYIDVYC